MHVAYAKHAQVYELITAEKPTKPMFHISPPLIRSIREA